MSDEKNPEDPDLKGEEAGTPDDPDATVKPGGLGQDGTIPPDPDGVAAGYTGEESNYNPEEDEQA